MHRRIGRVAQRWIVDRPGGERKRRQHGEADQRDAAELAQPPAHDRAELAGEKRHAVETAVDHRHRVISPKHRDQAMKRLGGDLLVLHHGDADIVGAGIAAVGLLAREVAAGHDADAGFPP